MKKIVTLVVGILLMLCLGSVYTYSVIKQELIQYLGISVFESGIPYMVSLFFYAMSMLMTGRFINRVPLIILMGIGSLLVSGGWILASYTHNLLSFTLFYGVMMGIGIGMLYGAPIRIINDLVDKNSGLFTGLLLMGFGLSPMLTAPLFHHLLEANGLTGLLRYIGILYLLLLVTFSMLLYTLYRMQMKLGQGHEDVVKAKKSANFVWTKAYRKSFVGLYINFLLGTMIGLLIIGITNDIGVLYVGLTPKVTAWWISSFALANGIGRPLWGWIMDKYHIQKAIYLAYSSVILATLILIFAPTGSTLAFVISLSLFWLSLGAWLSIAPTATKFIFGKENQSYIYGMLFTAYGFSAILGVTMSGLITSYFSSYTFILIAILITASFGIFLASKNKILP